MPYDDFDDDPISGGEMALGVTLAAVIIVAVLFASFLFVAWVLRSV